jgi:hypothetical protein
MTLLVRGWHWLADEPHHRPGLRVLQCAIGLALLFRAFSEAPFAAYLWGPHGLGWGSTQRVLGPTLGGLVDGVFATEIGTLGVVVALAAGALGLLMGYRTDVATAVALVAFLLLEQRLPELMDRGDTITRLTLTYMLLALPSGAQAVRGSLAVWLHNVAVLAIALQVSVLYANSGLWKLAGDQWQHGTALYYISQVEWVSLPAMREMFKHPLVTTIATYSSVLYETLFPVAIVSPLRLPWLAFGMVFHLGIAVFLGFVTFSMVMIGLLLFLMPDRHYVVLRAWLHAGWRQGRGWAKRLGAARPRAAQRP